MAKTLKSSWVTIVIEGETVKVYGNGIMGSSDDSDLSKPVGRAAELSAEVLQKAADVFAANEAAIKAEQEIE